jgi:hypothetical protein
MRDVRERVKGWDGKGREGKGIEGVDEMRDLKRKRRVTEKLRR